MSIRIWYESSVAIGANPVYRPYEEAIARNAHEVVRPDTTVDVRGVTRMSVHYEGSKYARYLNAISIVRSAASAAAQGYDAIAVGCYIPTCGVLNQVLAAVSRAPRSARSTRRTACNRRRSRR